MHRADTALDTHGVMQLVAQATIETYKYGGARQG